MKIAILGEVARPIGQDSSAGTEIWTYNYAEALHKKGHQVTLFAGEAKFSGRVVRVGDIKKVNIGNKDEASARNRLFLSQAATEILKRQNEFDVIHLSVYGFHYVLPILRLADKPIVVTIHGYIHSKEFARQVFDYCPDVRFVFISNAFASGWPKPRNYQVIYNGIDPGKFVFSPIADDYYFWLNRINRDKGPEHAIESAQKTGAQLLMAGPVSDQEYFDKVIQSNLSAKIKYIGVLNHRNKVKIYSKAKALLMTINWEEPFGLNVVEAFASGTPTIAFAKGAMPELIKDKETGYLIDFRKGADGIAAAIKQLESLSPEEYQAMRYACRKHVEQNFTLAKMVDGYEEVYKKVIDSWRKKRYN